jgi:hypothetical protein
MLRALGVVIFALPTLALAQQRDQTPAERRQQMTRRQEVQETRSYIDSVVNRLHDLNRFMERGRPEQSFPEMGRGLAQVGEQLQQMVRRVEQLHNDPTLPRDADRSRATDRLHDRLRAMIRDLDEAQQALRVLAIE